MCGFGGESVGPEGPPTHAR
ncbi:DUF6053 domain-containing protein [Lysobacter enzymogenes]